MTTTHSSPWRETEVRVSEGRSRKPAERIWPHEDLGDGRNSSEPASQPVLYLPPQTRPASLAAQITLTASGWAGRVRLWANDSLQVNLAPAQRSFMQIYLLPLVLDFHYDSLLMYEIQKQMKKNINISVPRSLDSKTPNCSLKFLSVWHFWLLLACSYQEAHYYSIVFILTFDFNSISEQSHRIWTDRFTLLLWMAVLYFSMLIYHNYLLPNFW